MIFPLPNDSHSPTHTKMIEPEGGRGFQAFPELSPALDFQSGTKLRNQVAVETKRFLLCLSCDLAFSNLFHFARQSLTHSLSPESPEGVRLTSPPSVFQEVLLDA